MPDLFDDRTPPPGDTAGHPVDDAYPDVDDLLYGDPGVDHDESDGLDSQIQARLRAATSPYVVLASPLMLETSQKDYCDLVVVVDVPESVQLARTMHRDDNDESQVRRIMAAQMDRQQRLELADEVIDNSGGIDALETQVAALHQRLLQRLSSGNGQGA